jgi:uncharacterized protein with von Willebrand factor type A (vWA) domain
VERLIAAGTLSPAQEVELTAKRDSLDVMELARQIDLTQRQLIKLVVAKTRRLEEQAKPKPPDPKGIRTSGPDPMARSQQDGTKSE